MNNWQWILWLILPASFVAEVIIFIRREKETRAEIEELKERIRRYESVYFEHGQQIAELKEKLSKAVEYVDKVLKLRELKAGDAITEDLIKEVYFGEHSKDVFTKIKGGME